MIFFTHFLTADADAEDADLLSLMEEEICTVKKGQKKGYRVE